MGNDKITKLVYGGEGMTAKKIHVQGCAESRSLGRPRDGLIP